MAGLTEEGKTRVDDLLGQIFADREYIEPYETELWDCYIRCIREPLCALFEIGLEIYILDERRDLLLPSVGEVKPLSDHMECRVQHIMVVPRNGCFRLSPDQSLHAFSDSCPQAGENLYRAARHCDEGMSVLVYANALWAPLRILVDVSHYES